MKILFMGTPDFALESLIALYNSRHEICAVVTQPDKPAGRNMKLTAPPVKEFAVEHGIPVYQPQRIKEGQLNAVLNEHNPDLICVVAYGKILPEFILRYPKYGCINVHASILPKYRGSAPINWAIINGETTSGVTIMHMDIGCDTGDIISVEETPIKDDETAGELYDRLKVLGAELLIRTIDDIEAGKAQRTRQNDSLSTHAPMLSKSMAAINWNLNARDIVNHIRGLNPWPIAYTSVNGEIIKVYTAQVIDKKKNLPNGSVITDIKGGLAVSCADGVVLITELQAQGKKRMSACDYLRGHSISDGEVLS